MKKRMIIGLVFSVLLTAVITAFGFSHERDQATKIEPLKYEYTIVAVCYAPEVFDFTPSVITLPYTVGYSKLPTIQSQSYCGFAITDCLKIPICGNA